MVRVNLDDSEKVDLKLFLIWVAVTGGIFKNAFGTIVLMSKSAYMYEK